MSQKALELRLAALEEKLNRLLEGEVERGEVELIAPEDVPEKITLNVPQETIPRRVQMDLVIMGGSRPRHELTLDLILMGGSRPRQK